MTTFYALAARMSGLAAVVCAALAVLAYPGPAHAEDFTTCMSWCGSLYAPGSADFTKCMNDCTTAQTGKCGGNSCSKDCVDKGSMGNCGSKFCNNGGGCISCKCDQIDEFDTNCTCRDK